MYIQKVIKLIEALKEGERIEFIDASVNEKRIFFVNDKGLFYYTPCGLKVNYPVYFIDYQYEKINCGKNCLSIPILKIKTKNGYLTMGTEYWYIEEWTVYRIKGGYTKIPFYSDDYDASMAEFLERVRKTKNGSQKEIIFEKKKIDENKYLCIKSVIVE